MAETSMKLLGLNSRGPRVRAVISRFILSAMILFMLLGQAVASAAEEYLPETIYELIEAFDLLFKGMLTPEERQIAATLSPEEIKDSHPVVYQKIRQNVKHWTDRWVLKVSDKLDKVPTKRLASGMQALDRVDGILKNYFETNDWPYRKLQVVFLPQRVFFNPRASRRETLGMFIPFYPEVFFATIDPNTPTEWVLMHESIHYNKTGKRLGRRLTEGITETLSRELVERNELLTKRALRKHQTYTKERELVSTILDMMVERTGHDREAALDTLANAYLSGDQSEMYAIFGDETWEKALELSRSGDWKRTIRGVKEALRPAREGSG